MNFTEFLNGSLTWLTVIAQLIVLKIIFSLIFAPKKGMAPVGLLQIYSDKTVRFFKKFATHVIFVVTFVAMAGSLSYSDILGYTPCVMCWYQRIAMYPMVLLSFIALMLKDRKIYLYTLSLSIVGAGLSIYHYLMQVGVVVAPCSKIGYSVSCSDTFILRLGYITIPMMALSAFLIVAVVSWIAYFGDIKDQQKN